MFPMNETSKHYKVWFIVAMLVATSAFTSCSDDDDDSSDNYSYVDLGLSVKWATCNIGAESPDEYGDYFAFGEIEPKSSYTSTNSITYGVDMTDIAGDADYDAARYQWGKKWRLPTEDEVLELIDECSWSKNAINGTSGFTVTGPSGKSIFLPCAGYMKGTSRNYGSEQCRYWSSTPDEDGEGAAAISASNKLTIVSYQREAFYYRYTGLSIRPVRK